jgi:DNA primase
MSDNNTSIDRAQIEEIKQRLDIQEIVKEYVKLKPAGKNLFGLCPFHSEDTPSFSVNSELGIFKCFGCGESGDVIEFLMKIENLEFPEALKQLAKRAGVELKSNHYNKAESKKYTQAKEAHEYAAKYFHYILMKHNAGKKARQYIKKRKLSKEAIEEFKIGFAPGFDYKGSLISFLKKRNFKPKQLVDFGLAKTKDNKIYDKFYDRLMFPIFDTSRKVIGFSGRIIDSAEKRPKYMNTPETILFKKRNNLFGLYQAKKAIREKDFVILVEGQTDVISSWQVDVKNIVAPLGTGITKKQIRQIKRFTRNIALSFDNDRAGIKARLRASELAYKQGLNVEAIEIPKGKDADECIKIDPSLWKEAVRSKIPTITYFLEKMAKKADLTSLDSKQRILKFVIPLLTVIDDKVVQDHHIKEISQKSGISENILRKYINSPKYEKHLKAEIEHEQKIEKSDLSLESYLLAILLQNKRYISKYEKQIKKLEFQSQEISAILQSIIEQANKNPGDLPEEKQIKDLLSPSQQILFEDALMRPLWLEEPTESDIKEEIIVSIKRIHRNFLEKKRRKIKEEIRRLEELKKSQKADKLLSELNDFNEELSKLNSEIE